MDIWQYKKVYYHIQKYAACITEILKENVNIYFKSGIYPNQIFKNQLHAATKNINKRFFTKLLTGYYIWKATNINIHTPVYIYI